MSGRVVSFFKRTTSRDWSAQELAEFYRVEAALLQSGMCVSLDRGVTDEGDPWFVFCRTEDDEVIVHFARIDGRYLISAPTFGGNVSGHDFRTLVRDLVERHPVLRPARRDENVSLHPSALLVMLVASALLKMSHAAAAATERPSAAHAAVPEAAPFRMTIGGVEHTADLVSQETQQYVAMLSVIALGLGSLDNASMPVFVVTAPAPEQPLPVHSVPLAHEFAGDWDSAGGMGGSGSVAPPAPPPPAPVISPLAESGAAHTHDVRDVASWQMQPTPIGGGLTLPFDLVTAPAVDIPATPSPAAAPTEAPAAASPGPIQGNHDVAGTLLQVFGGNEPIQYSDTLPAALVAPLHSSIHTLAATLGAEPHDAVTTPAPITPLSFPASVFVPGGPIAIAGSNTNPAVETQYGTLLTAASISAPSQSPGPGATDLSAVLTLMQDFAQAVGPQHLAFLESGNQVIEYDYFAVDHPSAALIAVTYDFADGSHISLVGLKNEMPHTAV